MVALIITIHCLCIGSKRFMSYPSSEWWASPLKYEWAPIFTFILQVGFTLIAFGGMVDLVL